MISKILKIKKNIKKKSVFVKNYFGKNKKNPTFSPTENLLENGKSYHQVMLKSSSKIALLKLSTHFINAGVLFSIVSLPTKIKKISLIKSPHVFKRAKEHFELRTYRVSLLIKNMRDVYTIKNLFLHNPSSVKLKYVFSSRKEK